MKSIILAGNKTSAEVDSRYLKQLEIRVARLAEFSQVLILSNALDDLESGSLDTLHLVFAGKSSHGEALRATVEATGAQYGSILR